MGIVNIYDYKGSVLKKAGVNITKVLIELGFKRKKNELAHWAQVEPVQRSWSVWHKDGDKKIAPEGVKLAF